MNTATLHETTAIAAAVAVVIAAQELLLIPLSKLRPSSRNVRKSGGTSIPELAASIARVGLLQNLNVVLAAASPRSSCWSSGASSPRTSRWPAFWGLMRRRAPSA